jgi:hypothetical protein
MNYLSLPFLSQRSLTNNQEQTSIVQANPSNGIYQILWNVNKLLDKLKQEITGKS